MESSSKTNGTIASFIGGATITGIFLAGVLLAQSQISTKKSTEEFKKAAEQVIQEQLADLPKQPPEQVAYPDYFVTTEKLHKLVLATNQSSYVGQTGEVVGRISKKLRMKGRIARGYLLFEANTNKGTPLTVYDSAYAILGFDGGHLLRSQSLAVPQASGSLLLFAINDIPYLPNLPYNDTFTPNRADWIQSLNKNQTLVFQAFLSSRAGGTIQRLWIAYDCEDASKDCSLDIVE